MGHSSAVGVLAFALCLVVCVLASATSTVSQEGQSPAITEGEAKQAVEDAKPSTKKACDNAQNYIKKAKGLLLKVELFKKEAKKAKFQGREAAKDNNDAAGICENIKTIYNEVRTLYHDAKNKLEKTIANLGKWLSEAQTLERECYKKIVANEDSPVNYSHAKDVALGIKTFADALNINITDALTIINAVESTAGTMEQNVKEAQVKNFHVNVIVAVAKIESKAGDADGIIFKTEKQEKDINDIVKRMQTLRTKAPNDLTKSFDVLMKSVNDELRNAADAVVKTEQAKINMTKQKEIAGAALTDVHKAQNVNTAQEEETKAKACVNNLEEIVLQLKTALHTAEASVEKAKLLKQEMENALSKATSEHNAAEVKKREGANPSVGAETDSHQKDTTIQPSITNTEQPTSKDSLVQGDKSANKLKDTLSKSLHNVTTTALTGEKAPASGAKNDSAMTLSVPLLVVLIASTVWQ